MVSTAPVAYVYVSSNVYASNPEIYAYGAASNGKLTAGGRIAVSPQRLLMAGLWR